MGLGAGFGVIAGAGQGALKGWELGTEMAEKEAQTKRINDLTDIAQAKEGREAEANVFAMNELRRKKDFEDSVKGLADTNKAKEDQFNTDFGTDRSQWTDDQKAQFVTHKAEAAGALHNIYSGYNPVEAEKLQDLKLDKATKLYKVSKDLGQKFWNGSGLKESFGEAPVNIDESMSKTYQEAAVHAQELADRETDPNKKAAYQKIAKDRTNQALSFNQSLHPPKAATEKDHFSLVSGNEQIGTDATGNPVFKTVPLGTFDKSGGNYKPFKNTSNSPTPNVDPATIAKRFDSVEAFNNKLNEQVAKTGPLSLKEKVQANLIRNEISGRSSKKKSSLPGMGMVGGSSVNDFVGM